MKKRTHQHEAARLIEVCACGAARYQDGEWDGQPDPLAQSLTARRYARLAPEERHEMAVQAAATRWAGKKKSAMREYMREIAQQPRPNRKPWPDRCPCGKYSKTLAAKRGHKCTEAPNGR